MSDDDRVEVADWQRATFTPHFGDPFDLTPYLAWPQRRPRKQHTDQGAPMSDWSTKEMVDAGLFAQNDMIPTDPHSRAEMRATVAAVLDAAPKADGWVWCEHHEAALADGHDSTASWGDVPDDCPGPHRTLIIGPEVDW